MSGTIPESIRQLTGVGVFNLSTNELEGTIPDSICTMLDNEADGGMDTFYIANNNLCPPYPECIEEHGYSVGYQDISNCGRSTLKSARLTIKP